MVRGAVARRDPQSTSIDADNVDPLKNKSKSRSIATFVKQAFSKQPSEDTTTDLPKIAKKLSSGFKRSATAPRLVPPHDPPSKNAARSGPVSGLPEDDSHSGSEVTLEGSSATNSPSTGCMPERIDVGKKTSFSTQGTKYNVDARYSLIKSIGSGAYGFVCAARDAKGSTDAVAIKKIPDTCEDITDAKRILREIRLMRALQHENILQVLNMDVPAKYSDFKDVYIVTELMDTDLGKILKRKQPLMEEQAKFFIYQVLRALKYLHSASVMHRDLKPANILVNANCDAKICDFGLARWVSPEDQHEKTEYVVTRWYRAPELMLSHYYTNAIDMWSVGCIMADVLNRKTLFPGKDVKNQLELICNVIGKPTESDMWYITSKRAQKFVADLPEKRVLPLGEMFPKVSPDGIDLMSKLLQFDPKKRPTAEEALGHKYLADYHDPTDEPVADIQIDMNSLEPPAESTTTKEGMRKLLWQEALLFHNAQ